MSERERMSSAKAVLDACVLIPLALCDTLLRAAASGLYQLAWSEDILEEVRLNLVDNHLTSERGAQHRVAVMRHAFPTAMVTGHHRIIDRMTNDLKDRHILAAAVTTGAQIIVTHNVRDFPASALTPHNIQARTPDEFLLDLYKRSPQKMIDTVQRQAAALRNPPMTVGVLLDGLTTHAPLFVAAIKSHQT